MPRARKTAKQAAKKDTEAPDAKTEGGTPRRSGRAVTKTETGSSGRDATRSRRSSTAAQTAASVADSKSPKSRGSVGSRRDSSSPTDNRGRSGAESPGVRVKSARRNASRINYKESDGEEEAPTPKNDDNFVSDEEFEESDSDEKLKPKGRGKTPAKPAAKSRGTKEKAKTGGRKGRRGKPTKKKNSDEDEDEESEPETLDVSEEESSNTPAEPVKKSKTPVAKVAETPPKRGRRAAKATPEPAAEEKSKPSRRSARATASKDESPSKRPSRSVQAKRYTEEEDDDIEELSDSKPKEDDDDEEVEEVKTKAEPVSGRKRKRNSASEPNKRLKEDASDKEAVKEDEKDDDNSNVKDETKEEKKDSSENKENVEDEDDEAMDVDEADASVEKKEKCDEEEGKMDDSSAEEKKEEAKEESVVPKETTTPEEKPSNENFDDSASDSEQGSKADQSVSSGVEDSQESQELQKDDKSKENLVADKKPEEAGPVSFDSVVDSAKEKKTVQSVENQENTSPLKADIPPVASSVQENSTSVDKNMNSNAPVENATDSSGVLHSKEQNADAALNGAERVTPTSNATHVIHPPSSVIFEHKDVATPKANGAHDELHNNAPLPDNQNYPFPGRKYTSNSKLSENERQYLKDKTFSLLSYNMGESSPDAYVQKDKLLNEFHKLQSHVICLQQVAKSFYNEVLEPSLDALGFKGVFSQPEDSSKGLATFYKSSLFKAFRFHEASIKKFVDKELEVSCMDTSDKVAVIAHTDVKKYGNVLFTQLNSVIGNHSLTVANVQIPPSELSIHALQASCLAREVSSMIEGSNKAYVLCGEFNMKEGEAPYQLLRDGYLSNDMIEELQRKKDVVLPGKENAALINLLWKAFQHPSSNLCSSYATVLDHEIFIPEKKTTSPDLLWYSSDSLHTVGVLDVLDKPGDSHFSLKADIAFTNPK